MRIIGYGRVSDVAGREGGRFHSPEDQRKRARAFVKARGHKLVDWVEDLDESGGTLDRPGLQRVLERLEAGEADAIAVAYLSRLTRNTVQGLELVARLNAAGRDVLVADLDLDTSTPVGRAVLTVLLAFAQREVEQRRDSFATAQRNALERGVYPGTTPIGYMRDEEGRMTPNPATAPTIRRLYERRLAGDSWATLARMLDRELPREDPELWRPSAAADLVTTPLNIGRLEFTVAGERIVIDGAHDPLVSRAVWEGVVNVRDGTRGPVHREEPALLAGLVRCAGCKGPMSRAGNGKGKLSAKGQLVRYDHYTCLSRCGQPAKMSLRAADAYVLAQTLEHLGRSASVDAVRRQGDEAAATEHALEQAEGELAAYLSAVSVLDVGEAAFTRGARERRECVDACRRALAKVTTRVRALGPSHADMIDRLPDMSDREKNQLLRTVIDRVLIKKAGQPGRGGDPGERVEIVFRFDDAREDELQLHDDVGRKRAAVAA
jgi:site-specific DNA recombinase